LQVIKSLSLSKIQENYVAFFLLGIPWGEEEGEFVSIEQEKENYLVLLRSAIQQKHGCAAQHRESIHVHETLDRKTIWEGDVEVFELAGHPEAEKCYAWSHREPGTSGHILNCENMRLITVLGKRPVGSPEMAVRAAIFYDVQPVPAREMFLK
jgi:hypothetical protein